MTLSGAFFLLACALVPWMQTVRGSGRVIAYAPLERQQVIEAPLEGRVVHWWASEGQHVLKGEPILEISDNDPQLLDRLRTERESLISQNDAYQERIRSLQVKIESVQQAFRGALQAAQARARVAQENIRSATQNVRAAEANIETTQLNLDRHRRLFEQGLESKRQLELAELEATRASTTRDSAAAALAAANSDLAAREAELSKLAADAISGAEDARVSLRSAESEFAYVRGAMARLDVRIARQHNQLVRAPRDGTVMRMVVHQGEEQVSAGEALVIFIPDTQARAVEVWVDGNDAALISRGRKVRLQFEGWPSVQFAGWPSVAVGTFGGQVAFVDASDDGLGNFRVVVVPDAHQESWPASTYLRQGVRAHGWVLLRQVPLGFELWRRLNGFPPAVRPPAELMHEKPASSKKKSPKDAFEPPR